MSKQHFFDGRILCIKLMIPDLFACGYVHHMKIKVYMA